MLATFSCYTQHQLPPQSTSLSFVPKNEGKPAQYFLNAATKVAHKEMKRGEEEQKKEQGRKIKSDVANELNVGAKK